MDEINSYANEYSDLLLMEKAKKMADNINNMETQLLIEKKKKLEQELNDMQNTIYSNLCF